MTSEQPDREADLLASDDPDGSGFTAVYRAHVGSVLSFLIADGADAWTAADVTSETFAAALLQRRRYDRSKGSVRGWLLGIARHKLADSRRRWRRQQRLQHRLQMEPHELTVVDVDGYNRIKDGASLEELAADVLTPLQLQAINARVVDERSYADVGRELGISEPAARKHVSRGLAALRKTRSKETS